MRFEDFLEFGIQVVKMRQFGGYRCGFRGELMGCDSEGPVGRGLVRGRREGARRRWGGRRGRRQRAEGRFRTLAALRGPGGAEGKRQK